MASQIFFSVIVFFFSISVGAEPGQVRLTCATQYPTTSYSLIEFQDHFELKVIHHLGLKYMPIHQGLITVHDLETLKDRAELLSKMGEQFSVYFSKDRCESKIGEWSCFKQGRFVIGLLEVESLGFSVRHRRVYTAGYEFATIAVRFSPRIGSEVYTLPMEYDEPNCRNY